MAHSTYREIISVLDNNTRINYCLLSTNQTFQVQGILLILTLERTLSIFISKINTP